jgi:hypothetical protein
VLDARPICDQHHLTAAGVAQPPSEGDTGADLDSLEIGPEPQLAGLNPASGSPTYTLRPDKAGMKPGQVYTFFCRIHPFMRGAFKVVQ